MKMSHFNIWGIVLSCFCYSGCVELDFLLFDGDPASMDDYDFTKEELNGIDPSRITSERIDIPGTSDKLHAVYVERDLSELDPRLSSDDNITVIFSHGNRGNILLYWYRVGYFEDMGFNVVIYDYRGYGASDGETTEANLYQDAEVAYDYAKSKGAGLVFSVGYSMGGCPAIWLCSPEGDREVAGCFTESAFSSAEHLINDGTGYDFPASFFVDFELDNETRIATVSIPYMIMHGTADQRVGYQNAELLWDAVKDNNPLNRFFTIEGAGHRNVPVPSYKGEEEPREYSHPDEMPQNLRAEFETYKGRIVDFVVDTVNARNPDK